MAEQEKLEAKPIKEFPPKQYGSSGEPVFDNRVHIRDEASGLLVKKQHYACHKFGNVTIWERPIGSGNMFDASGKAIGQWKHIDGGRWERFAPEHSAGPSYERVLQPADLAKRNSELEAELAALKADMEVRTAPAAEKVTAKNGKA